MNEVQLQKKKKHTQKDKKIETERIVFLRESFINRVVSGKAGLEAETRDLPAVLRGTVFCLHFLVNEKDLTNIWLQH